MHTEFWWEGVKLSLRLTKYHAMKTYPVFNQPLHYEDVWGSGGHS